MCACLYSSVHIYICVYMCVRIYAYMYIFRGIYVCVSVYERGRESSLGNVKKNKVVSCSSGPAALCGLVCKQFRNTIDNESDKTRELRYKRKKHGESRGERMPLDGMLILHQALE